MDRNRLQYKASSHDVGCSVSFNFTGVAVFYTPSPLQAPAQAIFLTVDGETSQLYSSAEFSAPLTTTIWHRMGLENDAHTVTLTADTAAHPLPDIGTFQYTVVDSAPNLNEQQFLFPRSNLLEPRQTRAKPSKLPMILGSVFGGLVFLIFIGIAVMLHRQRKARDAQYSWKGPVPPLSRTPDPRLTLDHATSFSNRSPVERKVTMDYESHHLPNLHFSPGSQGAHHLPKADELEDWGSSSPHAHQAMSRTRVPIPARVHERYQAAMSSPESSVRPLPLPPSRNNSVQARTIHPANTSKTSLPLHTPDGEASPPQSVYPLGTPVRKHSYIPNSKLEPIRRGDTH